ncbi:MAG: hypothetical protein H7240_06765 [Glaciimonas sp.]|nr:hypothetical protein [Glaciimonas sp.]
MIMPLETVGRVTVIPSKKSSGYDKHLYKECHLVETFFCNSSNVEPLQLVMTSQHEISLPLFLIGLHRSFGWLEGNVALQI